LDVGQKRIKALEKCHHGQKWKKKILENFDEWSLSG
jgi:hypothetical protein